MIKSQVVGMNGTLHAQQSLGTSRLRSGVSLLPAVQRSTTALPWLPSSRPQRARSLQVVRAESSSDRPQQDQQPNIFQRIFTPLANFGYGSASIWQGGVGLFILAGIGVLMCVITWARNGLLGPKGQGYQAIFEFPTACGITVGTAVRIRGVPVGSVVSVRPSLEKVDVLTDINDVTTVIPRNSLIEANQLGLIAEPQVDITPQLPVPEYTANPLDEYCEVEGKVVCHMGRIRGEEGISLDQLVHSMQKMTRVMEVRGGMEKAMDVMDDVALTLDDAKPLLSQAVALVEEVKPLLNELRESNLVGNVEALTRVAAEAAEDINRLQKLVLDDNNVKALKDSVTTLTRTLDHIQSITGDVGMLTGDNKVQANLKQLIEALSRLVAD